MSLPTDIFDRAARRSSRDQALKAPQQDRWVLARMADELLARLDAVRREFTNTLVIGGDVAAIGPELAARGLPATFADPGFSSAHASGGLQCDEDRLPFADASFDLVLAIGTLDTVNDLPGALALIRRALRPDGLFLGAMAGAGNLPLLRAAMASETGAARFHPQIDVRAAGDLLGRAGFALPVADSESVEVRYATLDRLTADLRANGLRNVLAHRQAMSSAQLAKARAAWMDSAQGGKTAERIALIYLTGWAPAARAAFPEDR